MVDLIAIQKEQVAWSEKNFGKQHARYPLMGLIEECLEFDEAWKLKEEAAVHNSRLQSLKLEAENPEALGTEISDEELHKLRLNIIDAIGDIGIYMLDYVGKREQQFNDYWTSRDFLDERTRGHWFDLTPLARRLAHHQLKGEQGIRGTLASHNAEIDKTCRAILAHLEFVCRYIGLDFLTILEGVWSKVRLRDWTKNPTNAHEVAEASA